MIQEFPTLYKMDSKGKIRIWSIGCIPYDDCDGGIYTIIHGEKNGKLQSNPTQVNEGKNIGKANETTAWEQCQLEAKSLWNKQRDRKGYSETIPTEKPKLPMLAQSYAKHGKKIKWPAFAQPKLDGIRCLCVVNPDKSIIIKSRTNKEFTALDHLKPAILDSLVLNIGKDGLILDGELYNHDYKDNFGDLTSAIKRDDPKVDSELIQYHIYDICSPDMDFEIRNMGINFCISPNDYIKIVPTVEVKDFDDYKKIYETYLDMGYEGGMIRNKNGVYEFNRRSYNLQKYKDFIDEEFEIVGAYENKGKQKGECTFTCITKDGTEFGVKPKGTQKQRRKMWQDFQDGKLLGKQLTVRFFEWTDTDNPVPRFPVGIIIRDYE